MIIAGNWKMNLNINEAIELSNGLLKHNEVFVEEKIIIFPSFLIIPEIFLEVLEILNLNLSFEATLLTLLLTLNLFLILVFSFITFSFLLF